MRKRKKKKRRMVVVPVASMGDIAFLLIIFFMLASEFNKDKKLNMLLPLSERVKKIKAPVAARVDIDKDGKIYLDGVEVQNSDDIRAELEPMLDKTISDDQRHIQFRCDAKLSKEVFEPVLQAIAEAGGIVEAVGKKIDSR